MGQGTHSEGSERPSEAGEHDDGCDDDDDDVVNLLAIAIDLETLLLRESRRNRRDVDETIRRCREEGGDPPA